MPLGMALGEALGESSESSVRKELAEVDNRKKREIGSVSDR